MTKKPAGYVNLLVLFVLSALALGLIAFVYKVFTQDKSVAGIKSKTSTSTPIVVYDISNYRHKSGKVEYYERMQALVVLQGLVNRGILNASDNKIYAPNLFLVYFDNKEGSPGVGNSGEIINYDVFWFKQLCGEKSLETLVCDNPAYAPWLHGRPIKYYNEQTYSIERLIAENYPTVVKNFVIWDADVPATANAAVTISGLVNGLPLRQENDSRPGNFRQRMLATFPNIPVYEDLNKLDFENNAALPEFQKSACLQNCIGTGGQSTGSVKANVYRWLRLKYGTPGYASEFPKYNPKYAGNYVDGFAAIAPNKHFYTNALSHLDWIVMSKGFVSDLKPTRGYQACDDPTSTTDSDTDMLHELLSGANRVNPGVKYYHGHHGSFTKYTYEGNCKGPNVDTATLPRSYNLEHEGTNTFSSYGYVNIDTNAESGCCNYVIGTMTNASFYYQLKSKLKTNKLNPVPPASANPSAAEKGALYILMINTDYDASSWLYWMLVNKAVWQDPVRGKYPIAWAINPGTLDLSSVFVDYIKKTKTPNDYFVSNEGYGYANLNYFSPTAFSTFKNIFASGHARYGIAHLGTYYTTDQYRGDRQLKPQAIEALTQTGLQGVGIGGGAYLTELTKLNGTPIVPLEFFAPIDQQVEPMVSHVAAQPDLFKYSDRPNLYLIRGINFPPTSYEAFINGLRSRHPSKKIYVVDPFTFFNYAKSYY